MLAVMGGHQGVVKVTADAENILEENDVKLFGQFITTFPAGWSPQMVVKSKGPIPPKNGLKSG